MKEFETLLVTSRAQWRKWLKAHGSKRQDIWLIYHKKHTGKPRIPYDDAVEEALCYGWIDSTVRRIDDERYMQRFTPRRAGSQWSAANRKRAEALLKKGAVAPPGLARIEEARSNGRWEAAFAAQPQADQAELETPTELTQALKNNKKAREFFEKLPPGQRKLFAGWIAVAKKKETRERRAAEAVALLAAGKKLGMK